MATWLYQCAAAQWPPNRYRYEIWEGMDWGWPGRKKQPKGSEPEPGDVVTFFYAPSGGKEPGFYGWAVVLQWFSETKELYFRPVAPSDRLKMDPWWNEEAQRLADDVRGTVKQGTLWRMTDEQAFALRRGIREHLGAPIQGRARSR